MSKWTMWIIQRIAFTQLIPFALCNVTTQAALGKGKMCCKIFTENECENIESGRINNKDVECAIVEKKTDIAPILLVALALIGLLIIYLTVRVLRTTSGSRDVKPTAQERVSKKPSLHYVQLNVQKTRSLGRNDRNLDGVVYTSIMSERVDRTSRSRRSEFEEAISGGQM